MSRKDDGWKMYIISLLLKKTFLRILWFFVFGAWPGLNFKFPRKINKFPEKKGNQEKRKTCKTGGRTALLSVLKMVPFQETC